jgi:cytochrome bd-type quinol oxidase subunit 2
MDKSLYVLAWCLIIMGLLLILADYWVAKKNLEGTQSRRLRRAGSVVMAVGIVALIVFSCGGYPQSFPEEKITSKTGSFFAQRIQTPWGQISPVFAVSAMIFSCLVCWAGCEHWKRQRYDRAIVCFLLGSVALLIGILQPK